MHKRIWRDGSSRRGILEALTVCCCSDPGVQQLLHGTCRPFLPPCRKSAWRLLSAAADAQSVQGLRLADAAQTGRGTLRLRQRSLDVSGRLPVLPVGGALRKSRMRPFKRIEKKSPLGISLNAMGPESPYVTAEAAIRM